MALCRLLRSLGDVEVLLGTWNGNAEVVATLRGLRRVINSEISGGAASQHSALAIVQPLITVLTTGTPHAVVASCLMCLTDAVQLISDDDDLTWTGTAQALNDVCNAVLHYKVAHSPETDTDVLFLRGLDVLVPCICGEGGMLLTDTTLDVIFDSCLAVVTDDHQSPLLRARVSQRLEEVVAAMCSRVGLYPAASDAPVPAATPADAGAPAAGAGETPTNTSPCTTACITTLFRRVEDLLEADRDESCVLALNLIIVVLQASTPAILEPDNRRLFAALPLFTVLHRGTAGRGVSVPRLNGTLAVCQSMHTLCGPVTHTTFELLCYRVMLPALKRPLSDIRTSVALNAMTTLLSHSEFVVDTFLAFDNAVGRSSLLRVMFAACCDVVMRPTGVGKTPGSETRSLADDCLTALASLRDVVCQIAGRTPRVEDDSQAGAGEVMSPTATASLPSPCRRGLDRLQRAQELKRLYASAVEAFNEKPKRGIALLEESGIIVKDAPGSVAAFLKHTTGLDKRRLGEYLGAGDTPAANAVREAYVALFNFSGQRFLPSLRLFLESFYLPGEAQQIDRILQAFSTAVFRDCSERHLFASPDVPYLLAFSTIMCNTSMYNQNIKATERMKMSDFIKTNTEYGDAVSKGVHLPLQFLSGIYAELQQSEVKPPSATDRDTILHSKKRLTRAAWDDLSSRRLPAPIRRNEISTLSIDVSMFPLVWHTVTRAELHVIHQCTDTHQLDAAFESLNRLAQLAVTLTYPTAVDTLLSHLAHHVLSRTGGVSDMEPFHGEEAVALVTQFGNDPSAQHALRAVFAFARDHGDSLQQQTWCWVLQCFLRVQALGLLHPPANDELLSNSQRGEMLQYMQGSPAGDVDPKADAGGGSVLGWLLGDSSSTTDAASRQSPTPSVGSASVGEEPPILADADGEPGVTAALDAVAAASMQVNDLVSDSRFLSSPALVRFAGAAVAVGRADDPAPPCFGVDQLFGEGMPPPLALGRAASLSDGVSATDVTALEPVMSLPPPAGRAVLIQLLTAMVVRNRERGELLLPLVVDWLEVCLAAKSGVTPEVDAAVTSLFTLALRLLPRNVDVAPILRPLSQLDGSLVGGLQLHFAAGVYRLLTAHVDCLPPAAWRLVFDIVCACIDYAPAAKRAFEGLQHLVTRSPPGTLGVVDVTRPLVLFVRSTSGGTRRSTSALDLLFRLHTHLTTGDATSPLSASGSVSSGATATPVLPPPAPPVAEAIPRRRGAAADKKGIRMVGHRRRVPSGHISVKRLPAGRSRAAASLSVLRMDLPSSGGPTAPSGISNPLTVRTGHGSSLLDLAVAEASPGVDPTPSPWAVSVIGERDAWRARWMAVLTGIGCGCGDPRATVRLHAIGLMQRAILEVDTAILEGDQWKDTFVQLVFPIVESAAQACKAGPGVQVGDAQSDGEDTNPGVVAEPPAGPRELVERTIKEASNMCALCFLRHRGALLSLPTFHEVWLRLLRCLQALHSACMSSETQDTVIAVTTRLVGEVRRDPRLNLPAGGDGGASLWKATHSLVAPWCELP